MLLNVMCPHCLQPFDIDPTEERAHQRKLKRQAQRRSQGLNPGRRRAPNERIANPPPVTYVLHCELRDWLQYGFDYSPTILLPGYYVVRELLTGFCLQFSYDPQQLEQRFRSFLALIGATETYRAKWGQNVYLPSPDQLISQRDLHFSHNTHTKNYLHFTAGFYPYPLAGKIYTLVYSETPANKSATVVSAVSEPDIPLIPRTATDSADEDTYTDEFLTDLALAEGAYDELPPPPAPIPTSTAASADTTSPLPDEGTNF